MAVALFLALQTAAAAAPTAILPVQFDLGKYKSTELEALDWRDCGPEDPSEIVVCARRGSSGGAYPFEKMERLFSRKPPMAERSIGAGATAGVRAQAVEIAPGLTSHRVLFGIRMPF